MTSGVAGAGQTTGAASAASLRHRGQRLQRHPARCRDRGAGHIQSASIVAYGPANKHNAHHAGACRRLGGRVGQTRARPAAARRPCACRVGSPTDAARRVCGALGAAEG